MLLECTTSAPILKDLSSTGRENPWRTKKMKSGRYAASLKRLGMVDRARNVSMCGDTLTFRVDPATGRQRIAGALFCKDRLCPMCSWRRTLKTFSQVSRVMNTIQQENPQLVPLFLTLTVRNVAADALPATLDTILKGWRLLVNHSAVGRVVVGWFRALEVTYNRKTDTYHPHIHAIVLVDEGYFSSPDYLSQPEWSRLWRLCCRLDYDPLCDVRRVKTSEKQKAKAVAEVAKYTVKDSDYLTGDDKLTDKLVLTLGDALHRRRLLALGGVMATVARRLVLDVESNDLVNLDGDDLRPDVAMQLVTYHWNVGMSNYVLRA